MSKLLVAAASSAAAVLAVPLLALLAVLGAGVPAPAGTVPTAASQGAREPAEAIRVALSLVGTRTGWHRMCDRLVCYAYGHLNSGYPTAVAHWATLRAGGQARPGDRCPPAGAFVFWAPVEPDGPGHVALVTGTDAWCDPRRIALVSNDVGDAATGTRGGVYQVSLAAIEAGFVDPARYLGWSLPICAGARTDAAVDPQGRSEPAVQVPAS